MGTERYYLACPSSAPIIRWADFEAGFWQKLQAKSDHCRRMTCTSGRVSTIMTIAPAWKVVEPLPFRISPCIRFSFSFNAPRED